MNKTAVNINKLGADLSALKQEMRYFRSLLISVVGRDKEGVYRPSFVRDIIKAAKEKPEYLFSNVQDFLSQLDKI